MPGEIPMPGLRPFRSQAKTAGNALMPLIGGISIPVQPVSVRNQARVAEDALTPSGMLILARLAWSACVGRHRSGV
jgi:uncharacterized protein YbjT (DUF2867 family)